jgi:hypothetical protein
MVFEILVNVVILVMALTIHFWLLIFSVTGLVLLIFVPWLKSMKRDPQNYLAIMACFIVLGYGLSVHGLI